MGLDDGAVGALDEALDRLQRTGPEWHGRLSNHGPMVVEAMVRNGHSGQVPAWVDWYAPKLDDLPRASGRIQPNEWQQALGDERRIGDWLQFFVHQLEEKSWDEVLVTWWPRLLPGLAASATHSVIRLGHAVHTQRTSPSSERGTAEIGQSLAYWAARWLPVPASAKSTGDLDPASALDALPSRGEREYGFRDRLTELETDTNWPHSSAALQTVSDPSAAQQQLLDLITAATFRYRTHGHGNEIMLVHAATAPNAVARILPSLPQHLWALSVRTAWAASAAITTIYNPAGPLTDFTAKPGMTLSLQPEETFARAVEHRDEHVIKFTDTALDVLTWTANSKAIESANHAMDLIERD